MECLAGQYYGDAVRLFHEFGEWSAYLKLKPSQAWWDQLVKQKGLVQTNDPFFKMDDRYAPDWFQPSKSSIIYRKSNWPKGHGNPHLYFRDQETGIVYIYEWII